MTPTPPVNGLKYGSGVIALLSYSRLKAEAKILIHSARINWEHYTKDVPLGSGGAAVPRICRISSRQCIACAHRAKLLADIPEPASAPPVLVPTPIQTTYQERISPQNRGMMSAKPEINVREREALEDRDPNNLNQHIQIVWDDIVGEPEGARSPECAWRLSRGCFRHARDVCYTVLTVLIAPPCALCLGCGFACLAFEQIWCTAPCLRCAKIYFASVRKMVQGCVAALLVPPMEAIGHVCRHVRVNFRRDAPDDPDLLIV